MISCSFLGVWHNEFSGRGRCPDSYRDPPSATPTNDLAYLNQGMLAFVTEFPQFFTASIKRWYKLLEHDQYKDIIVNSLCFLAEDKRIKLYAFGIMPDRVSI